MQIAYSVLKQTDRLAVSGDFSSKWTSAMQGANIPEWAYPTALKAVYFPKTT